MSLTLSVSRARSGRLAAPALVALFGLLSAPAFATHYYYVGGPNPGSSNDGTWQWSSSGIQTAYDWIRTSGAGYDWDIRVYGAYSENLGASKIEFEASAVTINRIQGGMTWTTGSNHADNVAQNLAAKSVVSGTSDRVFFLHGQPLVLDGFDVRGSVLVWPNSGGSTLMNLHVHGIGPGETRDGVFITDTNSGIYVLNSLVDGFSTGLRYMDNVSTRNVYVVQSTLAGNAVGVENGEPTSWVGQLNFFNSVIAAANAPVDQTLNVRRYTYTDVYDGDGSFAFNGVNDVNVAGSILSNPLLAAGYSLGPGSPCIDAGTKAAGTGFTYIDVDPTLGFQPGTDVVIAGTPPADAKYVILTDLAGNTRLLGAAPDLGSFERNAAPPVPEPASALILLLAAPAALALRRRIGPHSGYFRHG